MIVDPAQDDRLDRAFVALGDPVRRRIIARLSRGPATVNELAEPFEITKQAVSRHIQVLEQAELVDAHSRPAAPGPVHLNAARLEALTAWIDKYRLIHEQEYRALDALLDTLTVAPTKRTRLSPSPKRRRLMSNPVTITAPAGTPFIDIEREFDAPVEAVYRAHSDPELFTSGSGPAATRWSPAGGVRLHHRRPLPLHPQERRRRVSAFNGVFHVVRENEFVHPDLRVRGLPRRRQHRVDDVRAPGSTATAPGSRGTRCLPTVEARDGMVESGMETGVVQGYEQLDEVPRRRAPSRPTGNTCQGKEKNPSWTGPWRSSCSR